MKRFLSLLLVFALGGLMISYLYQSDLIPQYGFANVAESVSHFYINKNVNGGTILPDFGSSGFETAAANIVTSIVANYRSFDTLGEVTVLFVSALGVALLLGATQTKRLTTSFEANFILRVGSKALFAIMVMTGLFIAIHGHLTPGGGFPGGSMIASAFLLLYISDDHYRAKIKNLKFLEGIAGALYVGIGLVGLFLTGYFLENFLNVGTIGELFSAGIVPIVYVLIGLKVGSELANIIDHFLTEEEA